MLLHSQAGPWKKARSVNQTSASFVAKVPTGTLPTGDAGTATGAAIIDLLSSDLRSGAVQNAIAVMPYAVGSDNNTFSVRLYGWEVVGDQPDTWLWVPTLLFELACTCSAVVGVAGRQVLATERFADTLTATTAGAGDPPDLVSPTGDVAGHVLADFKGFSKLEFSFTTGSTGSPATSCNALFRLL